MFFAGRSGILSVLIDVYILLIFVYVLATWVPEWRYQSWHRTLGAICEPYLNVFRRLVPPVGMIDLSPMIAILALVVISQMLRTVGL
ncbi:MAG: hypothetical protein A2Y63_01750 [Candidatus Riflebacteria bacterium RBG_13_59_9]|nr:MAG: hypothetical protein A2Y63_01750 [Candidatus Riflebacteria bacterium RBG_13_59_9]